MNLIKYERHIYAVIIVLALIGCLLVAFRGTNN
jgi:hypothetical protein